MDTHIEIKRLLTAIPIEQNVIDKAREVYDHSVRKLALGNSVIANLIFTAAHLAWTRTIPTLAVKIAGDRNVMLMANPDFVIKHSVGKSGEIKCEPMLFALSHEAYHLLLAHLRTDPALMRIGNCITATESYINEQVNVKLGHEYIKDEEGNIVVVDANSVFNRCVKAYKDAGLTAPTRADFYATDLACFGYLEGCPKTIPPHPRGSSNGEHGCVHASEDGHSTAPIDAEQVGKVMEEILVGAIEAAKKGNARAKEEILAWVDATKDDPKISQMWGTLGAGALRGETTTTRKTDLWEQWTAEAIASKMNEGTRWKYNHRITHEDRISPIAPESRKRGYVFIDASGSMSNEFIEKISALVGSVDNIDIQWRSFDGVVSKFAPGEPLIGGGGTSFQIIEDHINTEDEEYDFVLVITDGYAPHIMPENTINGGPDKWIWLITPGGDTWPEKAGMHCREIDLD